MKNWRKHSWETKGVFVFTRGRRDVEIIELIKELSAVCIVIASIAGGIVVLIKILNWYSDQKEFKKKCEGYEKQISEFNSKVDDLHDFTQQSIIQSQSEMDAKLQEIRAEQEMITMCMRAVLDGLHQLNCNGPVTEASEKLDEYLNAQAHR